MLPGKILDSRIQLSDEAIATAYSVFSKTEKYMLMYMFAFVAFWSGISTPIYYPALTVLEDYFSISEQLVNVSVVVYLIAQGIAPTIFAGFADKYGRRPVLLVCLTGFMAINIGLALCQNYASILVLRIIQSSFIAPAISISSGAVGDFTERSERGGFVGILSGLILIGQAFGSLIGAGLISGFNWRAIFWFLAIGSGSTLVIAIFILPETSRNIVGNGTITPKSFSNRAPILSIPKLREKWKLNSPNIETLVKSKPSVDFIKPFKIMLNLEIYICLFGQAIHFVIWTLMLTSLSLQLSSEYGYSIIKVGLCYLPCGIGGLLGSMFSGKILDWNYKRNYAKFENEILLGLRTGDTFNIVRTRVEISAPFMIMCDAFSVMFGWCLYKKVNVFTVLISSFFISFGSLAIMGINTTLLIDLYPNSGSASTSCINFTRCMHAAIFVAALESMNKAMSIGGTFTFLAGLGLITCSLLFIPLKYGMKWAKERESKEEERDRIRRESGSNSTTGISGDIKSLV